MHISNFVKVKKNHIFITAAPLLLLIMGVPTAKLAASKATDLRDDISITGFPQIVIIARQ